MGRERGDGRVHLVRETPLRQARGLEKESKQRGSGEGAQRRVEGRGEKQTKNPGKVKKRKNGRGEGERSGRGQGEVSLVGTPDPARARRVLSASGVLSICEMQRRFRDPRSYRPPHHEGGDPSASLLHLCAMLPLLAAPCSPAPRPSKKNPRFSPADLLPFGVKRVEGAGRSVAHNVPSVARRGSGTAVCGMRAAAPRLPVVLHARLHRDAGGSAQSCIHTGCLQTCASPDCSSQGRWPSTCQPRGPCRNHTTQLSKQLWKGVLPVFLSRELSEAHTAPS